MNDISENAHPWLVYKNWAVIGASDKEERYGYKIMKKLIAHDYVTYPVSPKHKIIEGYKVYGKLTDIEGTIDVVDFVVNPKIGIKILDDCAKMNIKRIILQPGTASVELKAKAKALGIEAIEACVLVLLSWK
jgi:predicted CoA-binding protein